MRDILKRIRPPVDYTAGAQSQRIISSHRVKRCNVCTYEVPETDIVVEDGQEKCPLCMDTLTSEWLAREAAFVAGVKADSARRLVDPPQFSLRALEDPDMGVVTSINPLVSRGIVPLKADYVSQSAPLSMIRGVATGLTFNGQDFTSAVSFTWPAGITATVTITSATVITVTNLIAAGGMATGAYSVTFNDGASTYGNTWINILAVR